MRQSLRAYKQVSHNAMLSEADSHQVIQALMYGALERMAQAKGAIERNDITEKHHRIEKAIGIIYGLQDGLDFEENRDIADNFYQLYEYLARRLVEAGAEMKVEPIDECITLLKPLADAWSQIPEEVKRDALSKLNNKNQ